MHRNGLYHFRSVARYANYRTKYCEDYHKKLFNPRDWGISKQKNDNGSEIKLVGSQRSKVTEKLFFMLHAVPGIMTVYRETDNTL